MQISRIIVDTRDQAGSGPSFATFSTNGPCYPSLTMIGHICRMAKSMYLAGILSD